MPVRIAWLLLGSLLVVAAAAAEPRAGHELGIRAWYSGGETRWNHSAPGLGDPTSVLSYDGLRGTSAELFFHRVLRDRWFARGHVGAGEMGQGSLRDEDYAVSQVKFSDTTSAVRGGGIRYLTIDAGRTVFEHQAGWRAHVFGGLQYWAERQDAYGLSNAPGFGFAPSFGNNVPVISNEVRWSALRLGAGATFLRSPWRISVDVAHVPYADLHNRDFHYLRGDLGGVPNIYMNGRGTGWHVDAELRRELARNFSLGVGLRYWSHEADGTIHFGGSGPFPLNGFESRRAGVTASLLWLH